MTDAPGLKAIKAEMARQHDDALASLAAAAPMATILAASLRHTGRLTLLGMGGSHWVNRTAVPAYRACGIEASAEVLSEALSNPSPGQSRTALVVSQSGASGEVLRYLKTPAGGEDRFGLTLDPESPLGTALPCLVGVGGLERAFAATRSLVVSHALHLAVLDALDAGSVDAAAALAEGEVPPIGAAVSVLEPCVSFVLSGRGALAGVAESGALCLMELARCPAIGFEAGQLRHGPMEMLSERTGVLILRDAGPAAGLDAGLARDCREAGCPVVVLDASGAAPVPNTVTLPLPRRSGYAAALASLPTLQRVLIEVASRKVATVGTPVRSSKITTTP